MTGSMLAMPGKGTDPASKSPVIPAFVPLQ